MADAVQHCFESCINLAAQQYFKFRTASQRWKPWITPEARQACIRHHEYDRYIKTQRQDGL